VLRRPREVASSPEWGRLGRAHRAKKGSAQKGRAVFMENAAPFIKWLEEAESEEDDE
jgi:hypothetical protein